MRTFKSFVAGCFLSLFLVISVSAGDIPGPGAPITDPKNGTKSLQPGICELAVDASTASVCEEATPNPFDEAMIFAIQLLTTVY